MKFHEDDTEHGERPVGRTLAPPSSEMNVTPLIDVLLVLLIIFMAALPLTQKGLDIRLPLEVTQPVKPPPPDTQIVVELSDARVLTVNKQPLPLDALSDRLRGMYESRSDKLIFVMGADSLTYGEMMPIIDITTGLHLKVAIVTAGMKQDARK